MSILIAAFGKALKGVYKSNYYNSACQTELNLGYTSSQKTYNLGISHWLEENGCSPNCYKDNGSCLFEPFVCRAESKGYCKECY